MPILAFKFANLAKTLSENKVKIVKSKLPFKANQ